MNPVYLNEFEWREILDEFSTFVKTHPDAKKIDYKLWRKLVSLIGNVAIRFASGTKSITICDLNNTIGGFNANDNSFGSFLDNKYNNIKEETVMDPETYRVINDCTTEVSAPNLNNYTELNKITTATGTSLIDYINKTYEDTVKENKEMETKKMFGNFEFGPCGDTVRMSMYGLAVKSQNGEWVSYDTNSGDIMNVEIFNFADGGKWFYKLPVAISKLAVGDLVIHNRKPCYITGFAEDTANPVVIDIFAGERKEILPQKSPFGFNFATKVVSLFDGMNMGTADSDNPFGNMWMFALMNENGKSNDMLLPLMMMQMDMNNPLMTMMLMGDGKMNDNLLPLMLMMGNKKEG